MYTFLLSVEKVDFSILLLKVVFGRKVDYSCKVGHLVQKIAYSIFALTTTSEILFLEPRAMYYSRQ